MMFKDPATRWDGTFPYDALAAVGITPESSAKEILDASYELMARGLMTPAVRRAWDELRAPDRRLVADFFMYEVDLPSEITAAAERIERELLGGPCTSAELSVPALIAAELASVCDDVIELLLPPLDLDEPPPPGPEIVEFDR
jgi:hypothetical protein